MTLSGRTNIPLQLHFLSQTSRSVISSVFLPASFQTPPYATPGPNGCDLPSFPHVLRSLAPIVRHAFCVGLRSL